MAQDCDETQALANFVPPEDAVNTPFVKDSLSKEPAATSKPPSLEDEAQVWKQNVCYNRPLIYNFF